jgi:hypothetical protein
MPYCGWAGYISNSEHARSLHLRVPQHLHQLDPAATYFRFSVLKLFYFFLFLFSSLRLADGTLESSPPFVCLSVVIENSGKCLILIYCSIVSRTETLSKNFSSDAHYEFMRKKVYYRNKLREIQSTKLTL